MPPKETFLQTSSDAIVAASEPTPPDRPLPPVMISGYRP